MSKLEHDPRPKRTDLDQMPCLADPNLACVPECRMYDFDIRAEVLSEVSLDLPPIMDVLSHHSNLDDPVAQAKEEDLYFKTQQNLLTPYCDFE